MRIGPAPQARTDEGNAEGKRTRDETATIDLHRVALRLAAAAIRADAARTGFGGADFICMHMNGQIAPLVNLPFLQCSR